MTTESPSILKFSTTLQHFTNLLSKTVITTRYQEVLHEERGMSLLLHMLLSCKKQKGCVYIVGNGGSAAIASHATIDFLNMTKMKVNAMLDPAITTCLSNDYGYESVYARQLKVHIESRDILIAISSSGKSQNMIQAVNIAREKNSRIITLSGFSAENQLRQLGDYNIWIDAVQYGFIEIGHAFILHYLTDRLCEMSPEEMV